MEIECALMTDFGFWQLQYATNHKMMIILLDCNSNTVLHNELMSAHLHLFKDT